MEEMPKYKVGDLVGFLVHSKEKENHVGQIVAIAYGNVYDIRSNINGVYYRVKEENITYRILDTDNKEILKRMVNDYHYGLFPGDIYTYVAVQLLFKAYSIRDIQDAIENCTYTKKEK